VRFRCTVRFRVDFGKRCSVGVGKIELLEGIARTGSLSQAAREMRMSYRRAWLLLVDMNISFDQPVANASVGGRGGGGVVLTAFGSSLVTGYRHLESRLQSLAASYVQNFAGHIKAVRIERTIKSASLKRKTPGRGKRSTASSAG
jgi:molybdate transport system regulatory protein